jgi:hypothetical protein
VFEEHVHTGEALVKNDLQKVRDLAEARIRAGNVPDWSWQHHVALIEAVDAVLHDISVANDTSRSRRYTGQVVRLAEREGRASIPSKRKADRLH